MAPELRQDYVRKFFNFVQFAPHMKALSAHPALLAVVGRVPLRGQVGHLLTTGRRKVGCFVSEDSGGD